ncbi:hypothetical protein [Luteimonas vadosa]
MKVLTTAISAALVATLGGVVLTSQVAEAAGPSSAGSQYTAKTERGENVGNIVRRWADYVSTVYGTGRGEWARAMASTFAQADLHNIKRAARMTTFEGMMSALMGQRATDEQIIDKMANPQASAAVIHALGSPSEDLVYTAIVPCRILDTRLAGGAMTPGETRHYVSDGSDFVAQGGASMDCGVPANASAVVMNVTTTESHSGGYITVYPYNAPQPFAASLNVVIGGDNGNEIIVKQTLGQSFDFSIFSAVPTHVVGDVAGYFMAPTATAMECQQVDGPLTTSIPSGSQTTLRATCPSGFAATGGGTKSFGSGTLTVHSSFPESTSIWQVKVARTGGSSVDGQAVAQCCRVPGR